MTNSPQLTTGLNALLRDLRGGAPAIMKAFAGIAQAATASNALDAKTKELIALGIAFHVKAAVLPFARFPGADPVLGPEMRSTETLGMAIYMGTGPSVMYASHAFEAFTQFSVKTNRAMMKRGVTSATFHYAFPARSLRGSYHSTIICSARRHTSLVSAKWSNQHLMPVKVAALFFTQSAE
jgi:alkylhydroperoxidase/carboxymuconolactone decarboxylase family protein YurZ